MTIISDAPRYTSALIDVDGDMLSIAIQTVTERNIDPAADEPVLLTELDLESEHSVAVPGRYMIEAEDGRTFEVEIVFAVPLEGGRFYHKAIFPGLLPAAGDEA